MADRIAVMSKGRVEQVDSPVDLYTRPRTTFVADFIGTSNAFAGVVVPDGIDAPGLGRLPGHQPWPLAEPIATLVMRPEDAWLTETGAGYLDGRVLDIQFFGGSSTVAVEVANHSRPVLVTCQGTTSATRGSTVGVAWDPAKAVILSEAT